MILRKGDCARSTARPSRKVPSKTGSPVKFVKSASTTLSLSVRAGEGWTKELIVPMAAPTNRTPATAIHPQGLVSFTSICTWE